MVMLLARRGVTYARVNWSRWICDCCSPTCTSALQVNRGEVWFRCWDCGEVAEIEWPDYADEVERILLMRPDPHTRNWQQGETLQDLYTENLEHGILPASLESLIASAGRPLFVVGDTRILVDRAPLPSGQRRQIGG